jgi:lipid II:glycine glycyltransferase (peptidoglycan interpeptide bridge formation enzyme)
MRLATPAEVDAWDDMVVANPDGGNILQGRAWGEFKVRWGWRPRYVVDESASPRLAILFLRRSIRGLGSLWYAPKGPGVTDPERLIHTLSTPDVFGDAFCVQIEPEVVDSAAHRAILSRIGLRKSTDVQISRATVVVDLTPEEDEILAGFKSKTRYNIRLAARKGVEVEAVECDEANVETMYRLMAETADRADFALRQKAYFRGYWRLLEAGGQGQLFLARHQGEVLAGVFATYLGAKSWYKDGGSFKAKSELMAPHLLQWEVMRWLRARGARSYDMVAVPRRDELREEHPLYGLWRFKSGFSEEITEFAGTWDLPFDRARYAIWKRVGEPLALRLNWRLKLDLFY